MDCYDVWKDGEGNLHLVSEMETSYINNCIRNIKKCADDWRCVTFSLLSREERKSVSSPLTKAWFVVNAYSYLARFNRELESRGDDTSVVEKAMNYINEVN